MARELELIEEFRDLSLVCEVTLHSVKLGMLKLISGVFEGIKESHKTDLELIDRLDLINQGRGGDFNIDDNGVIL
jgi:hypothetical protein